MVFKDRNEAGILLSKKLAPRKGEFQCVIGLARGGVIVASAIAKACGLPCDVLVVKKIPSPGNPEFALGAQAPDAVACVNWRAVGASGADDEYIGDVAREKAAEIDAKMLLYRRGKKPLAVKGKRILLVDDGAATGATMEAAIKWCKAKKAGSIHVALPVVHPEALAKIVPEVASCTFVEAPEHFEAVGQFYGHFPQVSDQDVVQCLNS